nr:unnamed protein product [Callosobruchus chinensis]
MVDRLIWQVLQTWKTARSGRPPDMGEEEKTQERKKGRSDEHGRRTRWKGRGGRREAPTSVSPPPPSSPAQPPQPPPPPPMAQPQCISQDLAAIFIEL